LTLLLSLAAPRAAGPDPRLALAQAIRLFDNFDDARAAAAFRELLRHPAPRQVAGKAHLYLGLIAINRLDTDRAMEEFKTALLVEPTLDFVSNGSPKARLAFDEARHALERQLHDLTPEIPASAVNEGNPTDATSGSSHALALTLGAVGLVAAGVGIYGGVDLLSYNNSVNAAVGYKATQFNPSAASQAGFWAAAWIPFVVAGALGLGAVPLTW
jgi:hypothetical protein